LRVHGTWRESQARRRRSKKITPRRPEKTVRAHPETVEWKKRNRKNNPEKHQEIQKEGFL